MKKAPYDMIVEKLSSEMPEELLKLIPKKWEKIGNVLILKIPKELERQKIRIAKVYANILNCKSVLQDVGGIRGELRVPKFKFLYGDKNTETVHIENGIKFKLDTQKIMFSSGNMGERIRMARISNKNEVVVDMFAGIGYFSIPMAKFSKPKKIYAIEKNPVAFHYLKQNIVLNHVTNIVEPVFGDNREVTPKGVADRVIMGYLKNTYIYLPYAIESLNDEGIIHYHEICPEEVFPNRPLRRLRDVAEKYKKKLEIMNIKKVKSYAPGIIHVVIDARFG